jgi:hypothetical protein
MTDRASSPTPSERKRLDADAKAKEQEEQSKLPYKWTQTIADLEVTIKVPGNFKGKDLDVAIKKNGVKAGIKGKEAIIEVRILALPPSRSAHKHTNSNTTIHRARSPTPSSSTTPPGPSKPSPQAPKNSASSSRKPTRWSGGSTS